MSCCEPYFIFHEICSRILIIVNKVMLHDDICTRMLHSDIFSFIEKNILQIRPGQCPNIKKRVFCTAKSTLRLNHNNKCVFFFYSLTPTPGHSFDLDLISEVSICCSQFWPSKFSTVTCSTVPGSRQCGATPYPSGLDLKKKIILNTTIKQRFKIYIYTCRYVCSQ